MEELNIFDDDGYTSFPDDSLLQDDQVSKNLEKLEITEAGPSNKLVDQVREVESTCTDLTTFFPPQDSELQEKITSVFVVKSDLKEILFPKKKKKSSGISIKIKLPLPPYIVQLVTATYADILSNSLNSKSGHVYPITSTPPGFVLIVNNYQFPFRRRDQKRVGSGMDVKRLTEIFTLFRYKISYASNVKGNEELQKEFEKFKTLLLHHNSSSCFVILMSHGIMGEIELTGGNDNSSNIIKDVMTPFSSSEFPGFNGKPKVFILESCQIHGPLKYKRPDFEPLFDGGFRDMLLCYSSLPGFYSYRKNSAGSVFMYYLVKALMTYAALGFHLKEIMDEVQELIQEAKEKYKEHRLTVPCTIPICFRKFYLMPPPQPKENLDMQNEEEMETED